MEHAGLPLQKHARQPAHFKSTADRHMHPTCAESDKWMGQIQTQRHMLDDHLEMCVCCYSYNTSALSHLCTSPWRSHKPGWSPAPQRWEADRQVHTWPSQHFLPSPSSPLLSFWVSPLCVWMYVRQTGAVLCLVSQLCVNPPRLETSFHSPASPHIHTPLCLPSLPYPPIVWLRNTNINVRLLLLKTHRLEETSTHSQRAAGTAAKGSLVQMNSTVMDGKHKISHHLVYVTS